MLRSAVRWVLLSRPMARLIEWAARPTEAELRAMFARFLAEAAESAPLIGFGSQAPHNRKSLH